MRTLDPAEIQPVESPERRVAGLFEQVRVNEQLHSFRDALKAARQGDFSMRLPADSGATGEVARFTIELHLIPGTKADRGK